MVVALLSTLRVLHQYIHHQGAKFLSDFFYFNAKIRSTCSSVEMLKGYMVKKRLGTLIKTKIFVTIVNSVSSIMYTYCVYIVFLKCCVTCMGV